MDEQLHAPRVDFSLDGPGCMRSRRLGREDPEQGAAPRKARTSLTASLAKEVVTEGITVNAICPGVVRTAMWDCLSDIWKKARGLWNSPGRVMSRS